eukprot:297846-Chlamydomonas_euryale.AAC.8
MDALIPWLHHTSCAMTRVDGAVFVAFVEVLTVVAFCVVCVSTAPTACRVESRHNHVGSAIATGDCQAAGLVGLRLSLAVLLLLKLRTRGRKHGRGVHVRTSNPARARLSPDLSAEMTP